MSGRVSREQLIADLERLGSRAAVAREYGIASTTLQKRMQREGIASPHARATGSTEPPSVTTGDTGIKVDGDTATIVWPAGTPWSLGEVCRTANLDPNEWLPVRAIPNIWQAISKDDGIVDLHQIKVELVRRIPADMILPARSDGWKPPKPKPLPQRATRTIVVSTDWHAPYQDRGLEDCYLQVLADLQPDEDWDLGDLCDFPTPSRHRTTKGFEASPQQCVDERYRHDARRVAAAPNAVHKRMYGNHDVRVDIAVTEKVGAHVARLARAEDTLPVLDLGHLLRYDELGIEVLRPDGDYHSVVARIVEGLSARHGTKSGPMGGAVKTMNRRATSQLSGHDHKSVLTQHVMYDDDDEVELRISASIGCCCQRALARSYNEDADIHLGFAVVTDHGGGVFNVELARYDDARRVLYFRDKVYRPGIGSFATAA